MCFFQLINNDSNEPCEVLYIVSPAYLFLFDESTQKVVYDDSAMVDEDWDALRACGWRPSVTLPTMERRQEAYDRLSVRHTELHLH